MVEKEDIAIRVAKELRHGDVVHLGIGIPTLLPNHLPPGIEVYLHIENGLLGVGPGPAQDGVDLDLVNAGKQPVTEIAGSSFFAEADEVSYRLRESQHVSGKEVIAKWAFRHIQAGTGSYLTRVQQHGTSALPANLLSYVGLLVLEIGMQT